MPFLEKEVINSDVHIKIKSKPKQKIDMTSKIKTQQTSHLFSYWSPT